MSMGLGRLFHRKRANRDLDEEIQAHLAGVRRKSERHRLIRQPDPAPSSPRTSR